MWTHLQTAIDIDRAPPDLRYGRLAVALQIVDKNSEDAVRLLRKAFPNQELVGPTLLELAKAVAIGIDPTKIVDLINQADPEGHFQGIIQQLLGKSPEASGLKQLIEHIGK